MYAALGDLARAEGDLSLAGAHFRESLTIARPLARNRVIAQALEGLASVAASQGRREVAARLLGAADALHGTTSETRFPADRVAYERVVGGLRAAESARGGRLRASQLAFAAGVEARSGSDAAAVVRYTEALALLRASGAAPPWIIARTLTALGETASRRRDADRAAASFREALALGHGVGSPADVARALAGLGWVACLRREWPRAARRFGAGGPGRDVPPRSRRRRRQGAPG